MNHVALVRGFETVAELRRDRQRLVERQRAFRQAIGEGPALDQLHDDDRGVAVQLDAEHLRDGGVTERGEDCASRSKRRRRSGSPTAEGDRTFRATSRLSCASRARNTSPRPCRRRRAARQLLDGPTRAPGTSGTGMSLPRRVRRADASRLRMSLRHFPTHLVLATNAHKSLQGIYFPCQGGAMVSCRRWSIPIWLAAGVSRVLRPSRAPIAPERGPMTSRPSRRATGRTPVPPISSNAPGSAQPLTRSRASPR